MCIPDGEQVSGLDKIINYGKIVQAQSTSSANTLFGDMSDVLDIKPPQISNCKPWSLTEQLDKEKEITGIYLSGHPLDHYKFEMKHFGITALSEYNEICESQLLMSKGKSVRLLCLVSTAAERISRKGNKFGSYVIEDYSGKSELVLFGDDYVRHNAYLQQGHALVISGSFQQKRYNDEYEFKVQSISLAENAKRQLTKQLHLEVDARNLTTDLIEFLENNMRSFPGSSALKISVVEPKTALKAGFSTLGSGIEMNYDLVQYLENKPEIEVKVAVA
jgi:DNA polymerase-3 subunit alpha